MAVLPPTLESTIARRVVGICTKRTPRMLRRVSARGRGRSSGDSQGSGDEADEVAYDTSAECEDDGVPSALVQ